MNVVRLTPLELADVLPYTSRAPIVARLHFNGIWTVGMVGEEVHIKEPGWLKVPTPLYVNIIFLGAVQADDPGSGLITPAHRAINKPTVGVQPYRWRFDHLKKIVLPQYATDQLLVFQCNGSGTCILSQRPNDVKDISLLLGLQS